MSSSRNVPIRAFNLEISLPNSHSGEMILSWATLQGGVSLPVVPQTGNICNINIVRHACENVKKALHLYSTGNRPDSLTLNDLKTNGHLLYRELLTPAVKSALNYHRPDILKITLDSNLADVPWDLLFDGSGFWGRQYALGRVIRTREELTVVRERHYGPVQSVLIIANPSGDLPGAAEEGNRIWEELKKSRPDLHSVWAGMGCTVNEALSGLASHDIVFFLGHGKYDPGDLNASGWKLADGILNPSEVRKLEGGAVPRLIVARACQSAATSAWIEPWKVYGVAHAFLRAGSLAYVGVYEEIPATAECAFLAALVEALAEDAPIGQAVKRARCTEPDPPRLKEDLSWAYYMLYGDPGARIHVLPEAEGAVVERAPEEDRCARCGRQLVTRSMIAGRCSGPACGKPLCTTCFRIRGLKLCPQHTPERGRPIEELTLTCGVCLRLIGEPGEEPAVCRAEGCDRVVCSQCSPVAYCGKHLQELVGPTALEMLDLERAFLSRVREKMLRQDKIGLPNAAKVSLSNPATATLDGFRSLPPLGESLRNLFPRNEAVLVETKECDLRAQCVCSSTDLASSGPRPLDGKAVAEVGSRLSSARKLYLALFSPTGWDDSAIRCRVGDPPVLLLAPGKISGTVRISGPAPSGWNRDLLDLFDPETRQGKVSRMITLVKELCSGAAMIPIGNFLSARELSQNEGVPEDVVVEAFREVERSNERVRCGELRGVGFALISEGQHWA